MVIGTNEKDEREGWRSIGRQGKKIEFSVTDLLHDFARSNILHPSSPIEQPRREINAVTNLMR
jgi:hypothetical protein